MRLFLLGVLLVFVKADLQFIDTGVFYYITNAIGYIFMYSSMKTFFQSLPGVKRIQGLILLMIIHSIGFSILNGSGNSLKTIALLTQLDQILAILLMSFSIIGMFMIFYILNLFIVALCKEQYSFSIRKYEKMLGLLALLLIIGGVLFYISSVLSSVIMLILLIGELLFIFFLAGGVKNSDTTSYKFSE